MRWVLAVLLVAALAGCTGSPVKNVHKAGTDDGPGGTPDDGGLPGDGGGDGGGDPITGDGNAPPVPTLEADLLAGIAPFAVNFTLGGADPDGDALTWTLDADGDGTADHTGTSVPGNATHTYTEAGVYNVTYTLSDGTADANSTLTVNVSLPAGPEAPPAAQPIVVSTEWQVGASEAGFQFEFLNCEDGPLTGVTTGTFDLPPEAAGRSFTATITATGPVNEWGFYLTSPDCGIEEGTDFDSWTATGTGTITGTVGEGWTYGATWATGGADLTFSITVA